MKKKILWLCNCPITESHGGSTGTWLSAMAHALIETDQIELANITQAKVGKPVQQNCGEIHQWLMPYERLNRQGLPSSHTIQTILRIIDTFKPNLIHTWGTENYWGLLTARKIIPGPALLDMQGIKYACANFFFGNLTLPECIRCIGPLEVVRPKSSLLLGKIQFEKWGRFEKEIIKGHSHISYQSEWVHSHVGYVNPNSQLYPTGILLRKEFYEALPWAPQGPTTDQNPETIFTSSSGATSYKGLHVLLRTLSIIKKKRPRITLKIAGNQIRPGIRKSGYARWLEREICKLEIQKNVCWLGPLRANEIIYHIQQASVVAIPSFIETYCLALAEAMILGAPIVVSFSGAMPEIARDNESALFYPPGDEMACASRIEKILSDQDFASHLGEMARKVGIYRNDPAKVVTQQLNIYNLILSNIK